MTSADSQTRETLILVDDRERRSAVPGLLAARPGVRVVWTRLRVGDYVVDGRVTVERKNAQDFVLSLVQGRLFGQIARLKAQAERPVFILQNPDYLATGLHVDAEALRGAIVSISAMWYLPILLACDAAESAALLCAIAHQSAKDAQGIWARPGYKPRRPERRKLFILQGLPRVGPVLARRLLEHFGSVEKAMAAGEADLASVKGIGREKARAIRAAVT